MKVRFGLSRLKLQVSTEAEIQRKMLKLPDELAAIIFLGCC
jgi:hypothetical protein